VIGENVLGANGALIAAEIKPGEHIQRDLFNLTFNIDTIYTSLIAATAVALLSLLVLRNANSRVPTKPQLIFETVTVQVRNYVEQAVGHNVPPWLVPLGFALFFFILFCNWLAWIPSGHNPEYLAPPTADTNLTFALTAVVVVLYTYLGFKRKGTRYVTDWFRAKPVGIRTFILLLEQVVNPLSLSLRLFGNIFAGGIMLAVIALLPNYLLPVEAAFNFGWKLFDSGLIAPIQAFIFSFLTILYFGMAVAEEH
jgi:F-type H+-transporting ATPase subunit a